MTRFIFLLLLLAITAESIRFQSIGVKGTLLCGDAPTPGIRVKLWDNDMGELVATPKQSSFTDFDGNFEFDDWTPYNDEVDPVIRIAHDCMDGTKKGQRLFKFKIPKAYVYKGKEVPKEKFFNLGTINLEMKPYNEERSPEGDISKREIRPHKVHRARRHERENEVSEDGETEEDDAIVQPIEEEDEGCASEGACPIHMTRKRRDHRGVRSHQLKRQSAVDETSDSKEEDKDDSGCSDGACPIDFSRKKRHESNDDVDVECTDEECPLNIARNKKNATKTTSKFRGRDESPEDRMEPW